MKKILLLLISSLSFNCYADINIATNTPSCFSITDSNLTGCFQNKTYQKIQGLSLMETNSYKNGSSAKKIISLDGNRSSFFVSISGSTKDLEKQEITAAEYAIIKGDVNNPQEIPNCKIKFTPEFPFKLIMTLVNDNGVLLCK